MKLPIPPLLVISDRSQARRPLVEIAEAAFAGGCRWFSLREKDLPPAERCALLAQLVAIGRRWDAAVMAHEDVDAVAATGAGGVHLPGGGDPRTARARLPRGLIGASAHSTEEARALIAAGADYVTASPVFLSQSKPGYGPALGLDGLTRIVHAASGPVVALGGVTAGNAGSCVTAGASGIAIMGEAMRAEDPRALMRCLLRSIASAHRPPPVSGA